ncbi:hypothetical protein FACS1894182_08810 [Bacteroidia bacterium]|nr:hypothetical protein FACS1894182_08810 [Bacteroidia bacterium]
MKKINRFNSLLTAICIAVGVWFTACEPENITTETYDFPDVYVALIKVSPTVAIPLSDLTIEGNDFDHVKAVRLWNDEGSLEISKANFKSANNTTIVITVPENAPIGKISVITDENKVITWLNGMTDKQIEITDVTPVIVTGGDQLQIDGVNLDLVKTLLFFQGETKVGIDRENFAEGSADNIVVVVPDNAPISKIAVISDYDQMIVWENTLTERVITVSDLVPAAGSIAVLGTTITAIADNLDLLQSVQFGTYAAEYTITEGNILTITIPAIPAGQYALKLITRKGEVVAGNYQLVSLNLDPVWDKSHVYFDFDGKNSWWGDCPQIIEDDAEYAISGSYFHAKAKVSASWYGLFWRNNGDGLNTSGVNVTDWVVKYDVNVLGSTINSIKIRLGNFWYVTEIMPNIGGWYTISAPLNEFKDNDGNGRAMTNADVAVWASSGDFGLADGGQGGEYDALFDNVRLESKVPYTDPVADPDLVIFNFEDRGDNNVANNSWDGVGQKSTDGGVSGAFYEITAANWKAGAYWWISDNWCEAPFPTVSGLSDYVIKMDVRLRQDIPVDDQVQIRLRMSGNTEIDFIPYLPVKSEKFTTFGGWITLTIPCEGQGLSDPTSAGGDWGIVKGWNPNNVNFTGFCVDNIRYEHK